MILLSDIANACQGQLQGEDAQFSQLVIDNRRVNKGQMFVAIRGERLDGHQFIGQAIESGASAILVDHPIPDCGVPQIVVPDTVRALGKIAHYFRARFKGKVIALTGSSGKTSVKNMLRAIFSVSHSVLATKGNLNNHIGVPLTLLGLQDQDFAVIEQGTSSPGEIAYLTSLSEPDVALVNNIAEAHLEGFGSLENIAREKGEIYRGLKTDGTAVINLDDEFASTFIGMQHAAKLIGFTQSKSLHSEHNVDAVVRAENIVLDQLGRPSFDLCFADQRQSTELPLLGTHSVSNALAAASSALALGVSLNDVAQGLAQSHSEPQRMQFHASGQHYLIDDTYNANPGSVKAAINYLAGIERKRILVLGDIGEIGKDAKNLLAELGRYAASKHIHVLLTLGDIAQHASSQFGEGGMGFSSKQNLLEELKKILSSDQPSVVLIKGSRFTKMEELVSSICQWGEEK